jgi:hypothetical protein
MATNDPIIKKVKTVSVIAEDAYRTCSGNSAYSSADRDAFERVVTLVASIKRSQHVNVSTKACSNRTMIIDRPKRLNVPARKRG